MISMLKGIIAEVNNGEAIVDVNGVGYAVRVPASCIFRTPENVTLYIDTIVREDSITLYGFEQNIEKELFRLFRSVSGIGPKTSLAVISYYSVDELKKILFNRDVNSLSRVPGIGKKTAERMIVELKSKFGDGSVMEPGVPFSDEGLTSSTYEELVQALTGFGYKRNEAVTALKSRMPDINAGRPIQEILRETLRGMM
ncbi:MAG: Holliday junction branch migration protein RuvA [Oligoflexia bacterium]|nr:Holliday junction branch migration protein RuvA [Oligoflexia bacterium]